MAYNKNLYTSADSALDAAIIYDQDQQLMQDEINSGIKNGDIVVGLADNLASSMNQYSTDQFVWRTTGGSASLSDGDGHLILVRGNSKHTGYVAQSVTMTVTNAERGEGEEEITAVIDEDTFIGQMESDSGTFTLSYTASWNYTPATYGITVIGAAKSGDSISVVYVKEVRGTITQGSFQKFLSSGWNLYNHSWGYAIVVKYSDTYGYGVSGAYTNLEFATSLNGARSTITVTNGKFTVPSFGYVFVTGGNNTNTAIWPTWSDWTNSYAGEWEAYTTTSIDFQTVLSTYFPYGLCKVGSYLDEIDLSLKTATNNVGRLAYSAENLATVKAMNTDYEYDTNYIYYGLATPIVNTIELDNTFTASDHGIEWFSYASGLPLYAQTLYGENLKNRLERDVVLKSGDTMTGNLSIKRSSIPQFSLINNDADWTKTTETEDRTWNISHRDKNSNAVGYWITSFNHNNGNISTRIGSQRKIDNTTYGNYIYFIVGSDGTRSISVSDAGIWRTALGVLGTSGGSITGNLSIGGTLGVTGNTTMSGDLRLSNKDVTATSGDIDITVTTQSSTKYRGLVVSDKNGNNVAAYRAYQSTAGVVGAHITARRKVNNEDITNNLVLGVGANGDRYVTVTDAEPWRKSLGLGTDGVLPITIAQGGSGQTAITYTETASTVISAATGCSINSVSYAAWGKVAQLTVAVKITSANSTAGNVSLATLKTGYRPKMATYCTCNNKDAHHCAIGTAGAITMWGTNTANQEVKFTATYILP